MRSKSNLNNIPIYVYIISGTLIVTFIVFSLTFFNMNASVRSIEQSLNNKHLPTIANTNQLLLELRSLNTQLSSDSPSTFNDSGVQGEHEHSTLDLSAHLYILKTTMNHIENANNAYKETIFLKVWQNLNQHLTSLEQLITVPTPMLLDSEHQFVETLTSYQRKLEQLRRLHMREAELLSQKLSQKSSNKVGVITLVGFIVFLLSAFVIVKVLTLIRSSISQQEQLESDLKEHQDHLESLVEKRTSEIQRSNEELEAFSYTIAHDLRGPLRSITSFSQIVLEDAMPKLSTDDKENLVRVVSAAKRMAKLIDDILDLAKVSREKMSIEQVDLSEITRQLLSDFQRYAPNRKVDIRIQDNLIVQASRPLMMLMLHNLLSNAWKFTQQTSSPHIEIGTSTEEGKSIIFVRDNGVGFDMQYVNKIFEPFQRIHNEKIYEGTGIGLAIVRRVIQRHHGEIGVDSIPEKGTTFFFTLPFQAPSML